MEDEGEELSVFVPKGPPEEEAPFQQVETEEPNYHKRSKQLATPVARNVEGKWHTLQHWTHFLTDLGLLASLFILASVFALKSSALSQVQREVDECQSRVTMLESTLTQFIEMYDSVMRANASISQAQTEITGIAASSIRPHKEVFHLDGVFTVPVRVEWLLVEAWGGGGGGGSTTRHAETWTASGGGGGLYAQHVVKVAPQEVIPVTVGKGGLGAPNNQDTEGEQANTSCFGSYLCAGGGYGGTPRYGGRGGDAFHPPNALLHFVGGVAPSTGAGHRQFGQGAPSPLNSAFQYITDAARHDGFENSGAGGSGGSRAVWAGKGGSGLVVVTWFTLSPPPSR